MSRVRQGGENRVNVGTQQMLPLVVSIDIVAVSTTIVVAPVPDIRPEIARYQ